MRCARTYFLANAASAVAASNGFTEAAVEGWGDRDSYRRSGDGEDGGRGRAADAGDLEVLVALYAAVVSAGRAAMTAAANTWEQGGVPEWCNKTCSPDAAAPAAAAVASDCLPIVYPCTAAAAAAAAAFAAAADRAGVPPHLGSARAKHLRPEP
jgi:hypothetical protein